MKYLLYGVLTAACLSFQASAQNAPKKPQKQEKKPGVETKEVQKVQGPYSAGGVKQRKPGQEDKLVRPTLPGLRKPAKPGDPKKPGDTNPRGIGALRTRVGENEPPKKPGVGKPGKRPDGVDGTDPRAWPIVGDFGKPKGIVGPSDRVAGDRNPNGKAVGKPRGIVAPSDKVAGDRRPDGKVNGKPERPDSKP